MTHRADNASKPRTRHAAAALALALVTATTLPSRTALAQQTTDSNAQARTLFERGVQLIDERRFAEAITTLEASERLRPSPAVTYNLGLAFRGVGRVQAAVGAFERYLAQPSRSATPAELAQIRTIVAQLRASLVQLDLRISPSTATVRVDGAPPQVITAPLTLDPGAHTVEVAAADFLSTSRSLELTAGSRTALEIALQPTPSIATLVVEPTVAAATVWIDGHLAGSGTLTQTVAAGEHSIRVECAQCETVRRTVRLDRGQHLRVGVDVTRRSNGVAPWVIGVGVGAGVAAIAAGVVIGVVAATNGPLVGEYTGQQAGSWGFSHMLPERAR